MVNNIKNNDKSRFKEYTVIPEVETDEMIAKKTLKKFSFGIMKKNTSKVKNIIKKTK